jgi:hypothetical protein
MKPILIAACLLLVASWMFPYCAYRDSFYREFDGYKPVWSAYSARRSTDTGRLVLTDLCILGLVGAALVLRWKEK